MPGLVLALVGGALATAATFAPPLDRTKAMETFLNVVVDFQGANDTPTLTASVWNTEEERTELVQLPPLTSNPNTVFGQVLESICAQQPYYYQQAGTHGLKPYQAENDAVTALAGQALVAKWRPFPIGARGGRHNQAAQFSRQGIRAVFTALYRPPSGWTFQTVAAQQYYDVLFKQYIRGLAQVAADVLANPTAFRSACSEYERLAYSEQAADFEGLDFIAEHFRRIVPEAQRDGYDEVATNFYAGAINPRNPGAAQAYAEMWCGTLMRRHIDGTLPTVLELIRTVLKDYDPEGFALYGAKLQWNG